MSPDEGELEEAPGAARYEAKQLLGRGGMGEVQLCHDRRIGRNVAMKVIRAGRGTRSDARARFLREARVQAQLEHPAIVPVYDLGRGENGQAYFTMKRVRGRSLDDLIQRLRDEEEIEGISQRRLLAAFSQVCLAVDFAHEHGVLHRDLKPANVMLGDYGEVYVLDWGLAKVAGAPELEGPDNTAPSSGPTSGSQPTADGEILGTPGYLAPEQLEGDVDRRSDVYALGAILFEVLTLQRLHEGKTPQLLLVSTLEGAQSRPSIRAPDVDVAPELEAICVRATAQRPEDRFATARALHEAIEAYLDGDRDLALRRQYAEAHAEQAREATERALAGDDAARVDAMREVGRALGLDPSNPIAMESFARLLETPPARLPEEALAGVQATNAAQLRQAARNGAFGYLSWVLYLPLLLLMGVRDAAWLAISTVLMLASSALSFYVARRGSEALDVVVMVLGTVALCSLFGMFGAYLLLPTVIVGQVVSFSQSPHRQERIIATVLGCLGITTVAMLEWAGIIPTMTVFAADSITIVPGIMHFPPHVTRLVLLAASLGLIITPVLLIGRVRDTLSEAERHIQLQAWHLRQLVAREDSGARSIQAPAGA